MRNLKRYAMVLIAVFAVASAGAGGFLLLRSSDSAESGLTPFRLCDTVVPVQPDAGRGSVEVTGVTRARGGTPGKPNLTQNVKIVISRETEGRISQVIVDPTDASVVKDQVAAADRSEFESILAAIKVEPLDAAAAPWPYSDSGKADPISGAPSPGSGLLMVFESVDSASGGGESLHLLNCRSQMDINVRFTSEGVQQDVLLDRVDPRDSDAFQRFADEVLVTSP